MNVQNSSNVNFKATVSDPVLYQLKRQVKFVSSKKRCRDSLESQLKNIGNWGNPDSNVVIAKDVYGHYRLGLEYFIKPNLKFTWAIKGLNGRTELSQFLALKESNILETEKTIKYLYSKYGASIFNQNM